MRRSRNRSPYGRMANRQAAAQKHIEPPSETQKPHVVDDDGDTMCGAQPGPDAIPRSELSARAAASKWGTLEKCKECDDVLWGTRRKGFRKV